MPLPILARVGLMIATNSGRISAYASRASTFIRSTKFRAARNKGWVGKSFRGGMRLSRWAGRTAVGRAVAKGYRWADKHIPGFKWIVTFISLPGSLPATGLAISWLWDWISGSADKTAEAILNEAQKQQSKKIEEAVKRDREKLLKKLRKFPRQIGFPFVRDLVRLTPHRGQGFGRRRDGSLWYSGRAASNWVIRQSLGVSNWLIPPSPERSEIVRIVPEIARRKLLAIGRRTDLQSDKITFYISNPVTYLRYLNMGSSRQARPQYVDKIVAAHQRRFAKLYTRHFQYFEPEEIPDNQFLEAAKEIKTYTKEAEKIKKFEDVVETIKKVEQLVLPS